MLLIKMNEENNIPKPEAEKESDTITRAITETAARLSRLFVSRDEVRQIAKDANPTDSTPQTWLTKVIARIKCGATYLTGGVIDIKEGVHMTLTPDTSARPHSLTIAVNKSSLNIPVLPTNIVNTITAGAGLSGGGTGDVTLANTGVTGIFTTEPDEGLHLTANAGGVHISNTGVTSMNGFTGATYVTPGGGVLVVDGGLNDAKISLNPNIGLTGIPKFFVTNFEKVGEYIKLWGCAADAETDPGAGAYIQIGPFAAGSGESGIVQLNGWEGPEVDILPGTNVTIDYPAQNTIRINATVGGTTGYTGDVFSIADIQYVEPNFQVVRVKTTYASGVATHVYCMNGAGAWIENGPAVWINITGGVADICNA